MDLMIVFIFLFLIETLFSRIEKILSEIINEKKKKKKTASGSRGKKSKQRRRIF
jgi:hypothetical protein